jgi:hypothetical protein
MSTLRYSDKLVDRQVGRNTQLYAQTIGMMDSAEERYPHLRILIGLIEQAHKEWGRGRGRMRRITNLAASLSKGKLDKKEVAEVAEILDAERAQ